MARRGHVPQRRCIGCGRVTAKPELVRLALTGRRPGEPGRVTIDPAGRLPGRGAYLCREASGAPRPSCLREALKRGSARRALRCSSQAVPAELVELTER